MGSLKRDNAPAINNVSGRVCLLSSHMPLPQEAGATPPQHAGSVRHSSNGSHIPFPSVSFLFHVYSSEEKIPFAVTKVE